MTEEEAAGMWCPMGRQPIWIELSGASGGNTCDAINKCIGSACMMWRRETLGKTPEYSIKGGYCGLAGKP